MELLEHAIEKDPDFAPAYVGLSIVLRNVAHTYQPPSDLMPRSYAAALAAVGLDENLADRGGYRAADYYESYYAKERKT